VPILLYSTLYNMYKTCKWAQIRYNIIIVQVGNNYATVAPDMQGSR